MQGGCLSKQEVCADLSGRYVVAKCIIGNRALLVVGVYGPNYDNPSFYYNLSTWLQKWADLLQLWGRDPNCVLNPNRDRLSGPSRVARGLTKISSREGMFDVWAHRCPTILGYTHYSKDDNGVVWSDAASVVEKFHDYYMDLYKSRSQFCEAAVIDYLTYIAMSLLTDDHRERLMVPLRPEEIRVALAGMPAGKAPGTSGLTIAFYEAYLDMLIPHPVTLFEEMAADGCMPPIIREALLMWFY
ncbi:hypothetical protein NDU88_003387 [Pleurodeles waltl]|uniref:Uncharacterized protein n=1 Tax=Pleurodeles waltl TaxID=8319 RepID=A0AAV7M383_PLEWA|nr:hypothetical protein NDU88_003387 [Pleurodeles waltl]